MKGTRDGFGSEGLFNRPVREPTSYPRTRGDTTWVRSVWVGNGQNGLSLGRWKVKVTEVGEQSTEVGCHEKGEN